MRSSHTKTPNSGLWRSVTERGCSPTGSVTGCAARHEARHSPRLRLAPPCSQPRPRPGVAELWVVRPLRMTTLVRLIAIFGASAGVLSIFCFVRAGWIDAHTRWLPVLLPIQLVEGFHTETDFSLELP